MEHYGKSSLRPLKILQSERFGGHFVTVNSFFLSIYPASPSREDYVQLRASKKSMIEES